MLVLAQPSKISSQRCDSACSHAGRVDAHQPRFPTHNEAPPGSRSLIVWVKHLPHKSRQAYWVAGHPRHVRSSLLRPALPYSVSSSRVLEYRLRVQPVRHCETLSSVEPLITLHQLALLAFLNQGGVVLSIG